MGTVAVSSYILRLMVHSDRQRRANHFANCRMESYTHSHARRKNKTNTNRLNKRLAMFYNHSRQLLNNLNHFARKVLSLRPTGATSLSVAANCDRQSVCLSLCGGLGWRCLTTPRSNLFITRNIDCICGWVLCVRNMIYQQHKPYRTV